MKRLTKEIEDAIEMLILTIGIIKKNTDKLKARQSNKIVEFHAVQFQSVPQTSSGILQAT